MIALIQRVKKASVTIADEIVGKIDSGLLVFLGVEKEDDEGKADRLLSKVLGYRVFNDENGKMNLNVQQVEGSLLIVSQFTLAADTKKGMRPSFTSGAHPDLANKLYEYVITESRKHISTETGQFCADMQIELINDGPVTFWLQV